MAKKPNMYNRITLTNKLALLLSTDSVYYQAYILKHGLNVSKDNEFKEWKPKAFLEVFGLDHANIKKIVTNVSLPKFVNEDDIEQTIIAATKKFRTAMDVYIARLSHQGQEIKNPILQSHTFEKGDFCVEAGEPLNLDYNHMLKTVGENAIWRIAQKLGLNRKQTYLWIDYERNAFPKINCGSVLTHDIAKSTFSTACGVYLIISPVTNEQQSKVSALTLRVSHCYPIKEHKTKPERDRGYCIRAKLNAPHYYEAHHAHRYHYRGELVPTNRDNAWSFYLGQAPLTAELEERMYKAGKYITPPAADDKKHTKDDKAVELHIADNMHIQLDKPSSSRAMTGLLSSLSQRLAKQDTTNTRMPYSAVIVATKIFAGNYDEIERTFMQQGTGVFDSPEALNLHFKGLINDKDALSKIDEATKTYCALREYCGDKMLFKCPDINAIR